MKAWLLLAALIAGCTLRPVDFVGKSCPCANGLTCDPKTNTCVDTDGGVAATCAAPVAFDATPYASAGFICGLANATVADGVGVGLDRPTNVATPIAWSTHSIDGCVGYDLGDTRKVASVQIRMAAVPDACGSSPCGNGRCGTGDTALVFYGTAPNEYTLAPEQEVTITATMTDYSVPIAQTARFIVVCRDGWSSDADDVVVDALTATCS